ncbi:2-oxoglutarate dehydrogenase E1 component [Bacillaceae bacterium SIJ1]|uniref:2-oxoglutarate dehydrogenase E1 component n=1 Tax=Litoribacterium kuwaitense TaxID=1398745 RepID=UPI0013ED2029|nr:2-oxoglutarate dehydrogenase E1 component [Litoribacterium kuwaitense]NGP44008.1 2-oxoglutarate dehydrogenase E1 component [Litoribacterium kuwaitense]
MSKAENGRNTAPWSDLSGPNLGYLEEQYDVYSSDPEAVESDLRELFDQWGPPPAERPETPLVNGQASFAFDPEKVVAATKLVGNIRAYGHLSAQVYPFYDQKSRLKKEKHALTPEDFGLTEQDLRAIPAKVIWSNAPDSISDGYEAIQRLRDIYSRKLTFEFTHVHIEEERQWLVQTVETEAEYPKLSSEERKALLRRLYQVEGFENFLHKTFVGQKRFSIEGIDMLVPMLDDIVKRGNDSNVGEIILGMAHRGRLNVLAHVLGKPYEMILAEFHHAPNKDMIPSEGSSTISEGWTGDVKYHLGANREITADEHETRVTLANNPSHLEYVNPVVEGSTRAAQDDRTARGYAKADFNKAFTVLIHGDAAFPGEGIVAETLNLSRLPGYQTGGTIHFIANNLIGFTTERRDARSTKYASDVAKGYEIPIVHVNADDPEACMAAVKLAYMYREKFQKDFLIDLVGYRRYGHNEMDDPQATQPKLYKLIHNHDTVATLYSKRLQEEGIVEAQEAEAMQKELHATLQKLYDDVSQQEGEVEEKEAPKKLTEERLPKVDTALSLDSLKLINRELLEWPENFNVYPKLERILKRRENALDEGKKIEWAHGEALAFASILKDGTPIRMTGQDSQRGTFAHRHIVLHDSEDGNTYSPMHGLSDAEVTFDIYNSPLSESAVLGFEYGYSIHAPETLVIWEAQYGDFANVAQVIYDQFLSAARAKWGQKSGLVMLLPHGYEGQGPEHSSARLERFLQLCAENNWTVANVTSAAQYFHILRRQAKIMPLEEVRPLVMMTPKSLIRNPRVASSADAFTEGRFQTIIPELSLNPASEGVKRVVMASGKLSIDLATSIEDLDADELKNTHVLRVEQLYPFPREEIVEFLSSFDNLEEIVWAQEEPKNMGAWTFMEPRLRKLAPEGVPVTYVGRRERSSTATGEPDVHKREQERIIRTALQTDH